MPKLPECNRCQSNAHSLYLVCAVHPNGVTGDRCLDFAIDERVEQGDWEPEGGSYYGGELILQPQQRFDLQQKWELLDWHPMFTGRCPSCDRSLVGAAGCLHWDCGACGWVDDSI